MAKMLLKLTLILIITFRLTGIGACTQTAKARLDPQHPVTLECWHYYNGDQLANFEKLVETFNETIGATEGIRVDAISQGNDRELASAVRTAFASSSADLPDLFATYPGTAFDLAAAGRLVDLSKYLSSADLSKFQQDFLAEGRFSTGGPAGLFILPIAKSSEVVVLNRTAWQKFTAENARYANPQETFATWEAIIQAAEVYQVWSGGKAMIGFDSLANFMIAGSRQLGVKLMDASVGKALLNLDREALHQIWNIYYVGIVEGSIGGKANYRAEDLATGDLIAAVVSTASGTWLPEQVKNDQEKYPVELAVLPYPVFKGGEPACVQQGAGMAVLRSDASREAASAIFLDWLIRPEQNIGFTVSSSYLPVTGQALQSQLLRDILQQAADGHVASPAAAQCLDVFISQMETHSLYY
ncbi:MAG TPA: hypothetical protein DCM45_06450, partial [Clostridiales bacterium]|nr:hypothetical protein [Clostridiales bacterium]